MNINYNNSVILLSPNEMLTLKELTEEEQIYYANYCSIELCDLCGEYFPILNNHDNDDYVEYNGIQFLCNKCK